MRRRVVSRLAVFAAAVATSAATLVGPQALATEHVSAASISARDFAKGPDPTEQSVRAERGPFATATTVVQGEFGRGFNKGTLHYPTDTSQGTFGAVAVIPGFMEPEFTQIWYGSTLASHGFVVLTLEPIVVSDFPDPRGDQLLAALDWMVESSPVRGRIDPDRTAVMGHSMGGGGTLAAANKRPSLKAAIPLAPWHTTKEFPNVRAETLIIGADGDAIASPAGHAEPIYQNLRSPAEKAYLELRNADHFTTNSYTPTVTRFVVSWLKRFVDEDTRYARFLCPPPAPDPTFVEYRNTCPV
ncbi:alpha/beta hydrolase family protein [Streptomyces sp. NPDC003006]